MEGLILFIFLMLAVATIGIVMYATGKIAEAKGYSKTVAYIFTFLFGLWATLIYALLSDRKKDEKKNL